MLRATASFTPDAVAWAPPALLEFLEEFLERPPGRPRVKSPVPGGEGVIPEGSRNSMLTVIAGELRRRGTPAGQLAVELAAVNDSRCRPPLDESEVRRIAASVARYPTPARTLAEIHEAVEAYPWPGTGGGTDWAVMHAHLWVARRLNKLTYDLSVRGVAGLAGTSESAVSRSHQRLASAGWLEPRGRSRFFLASRWTLAMPGGLTPVVHTSHGGEDLDVCIAVMTNDIWRWAGLGKSSLRVWSLLRSHPSSLADELAEALTMTARTIHRHLKRLSNFGLASSEGGRWSAILGDMEQIAKEIGTAGEGLVQEQRRAASGRQFESYLRERFGIDLESRVGRVLAGFALPHVHAPSPESGSSSSSPPSIH